MRPMSEYGQKALMATLVTLLAFLLSGSVSHALGDTLPEAYTVSAVSYSSTQTIFASDTVITAPFTASSSGSSSGTSAPGTTYAASGSAIVNADGSLGTTATISVTGPNPTASGSAALFLDGLTVDAPGLTGTAGTIAFTGTISGNFIPNSGSTVGVNVFPNTFYSITGSFASALATTVTTPADGIYGGSCVYTSPTTCTLTYLLPFTFGDEFEVVSDLDTYVFADDGGGGTNAFGDTAQITSIAIDAAGNPVTDFTISSVSGLDYTANGVSAPEPSSLALLGVGLVALGLTAQRRLHRITGRPLALPFCPPPDDCDA
jgi:hypothetical protein